VTYRVRCSTCGFEGETHRDDIAESLREMHLSREPEHPVTVEEVTVDE
jgi:hypothetical protein